MRQQYSGRYPFELLQNANDAAKDLGLDEGRNAYFLLSPLASATPGTCWSVAPGRDGVAVSGAAPENG